MTGEGVVLPNEDAAEVERRFAAFRDELKPSGEVGLALARRAAVCSVRMERGVAQETAALAERVRKAGAEFVAPEGASEEEAARLKAEACARAMFDPSKEATLARKYEAAAERSFLRALKELRQLEEESRERERASEPAFDAGAYQARLGSFLSGLDDEEADALYKRVERAQRPFEVMAEFVGGSPGRFDVPFTIGKAR
jgi:hypothetical protein